jgi:hypothetical protein
MRPLRRPLGPVLFLAALLMAGCSDLMYEAAPPEPVALSLTTSFAPLAPGLQAGLAAAFDQTNRVRVRVEREDTGALLTDRTLTVTPDEEGIRLRLNIDLGEEERIRVVVSVVLFRDSVVLFDGSLVTELLRGRPATGNVPLDPVASTLVASGPDRLTSLGETAQLSARLSMATGDAIPGAQVTWVSLDQGVVRVNAAGLATSVSEGTARIVALSQGLSDTLSIQVAAVVTRVVVSPASATLAPGGQRAFAAEARDARGNTLVRTPTWSTTPTRVATVSSTGVVTALTTGTAVVEAVVAGVSGTATLEVTAPPPVVRTGATTQISPSAGEVSGTVNPQGFRTDAWFEFGPSSTLSDFQRTAELSVGSGLQPVDFRQFIRDLPAETTVYYRIAARSVGGETRGEVRSFQTAAPTPPAPPSAFRFDAFFLNSSFAGFDLQWNLNSTNEEVLELDRREYPQNLFTPVAALPPGTERYLDGDVLPSDSFQEEFHAYDYRLRACNSAGCSEYRVLEFVEFDIGSSGGYFRADIPPASRSGSEGAPSGPGGRR